MMTLGWAAHGLGAKINDVWAERLAVIPEHPLARYNHWTRCLQWDEAAKVEIEE